MIAYFPNIYEDELLYSTLCRAYVHSGYSAYSYFAETIFSNSKQRIDIELINQLTDDAYQILNKHKCIKEIINQNTMFPTYLHFASPNDKAAVLDAIYNNTNNSYKSHLILHADGIPRFLKYCPLCVANDRRIYGEAIWHRSHQIDFINICPKHKVQLINSRITLSAKASPILHPAEFEIPAYDKTIEIKDALTISFVEYINKVLNTDIEITPNSLGSFLHSWLYSTPYVSKRGEQRNISALCSDIKEYYSKTIFINNIVDSRIQKLFTSRRQNFIEVCLLAYFLNIPTELLCSRTPSSYNQVEDFDSRVHSLYENGVGLNEISRVMGVSSRTIRLTLTPQPSQPQTHTSNFTCGPAKKDWNKLDEQMLPQVKQAIQTLLSESVPRRITVFAVTKQLKLPDKTLYFLTSCMNEIEKHSETQEEFWTRKLLWAYKTTISEGKAINWTSLRNKTNLRRYNAIKCTSHLLKLSTEESLAIIQIISNEPK